MTGAPLVGDVLRELGGARGRVAHRVADLVAVRAGQAVIWARYKHAKTHLNTWVNTAFRWVVYVVVHWYPRNSNP